MLSQLSAENRLELASRLINSLKASEPEEREENGASEFCEPPRKIRYEPDSGPIGFSIVTLALVIAFIHKRLSPRQHPAGSHALQQPPL